MDVLAPSHLNTDVSDNEDFHPEEQNSSQDESESDTKGEPFASKRSRTEGQEASGSPSSDSTASLFNVPIAAIPETIIIPTSNLMREIS